MLCCSGYFWIHEYWEAVTCIRERPTASGWSLPLPGLFAKKSVLEGTAGLPRRSHPSHFAMGIKKKLLLKKIGTCVHFIILKREGSLFAPSCCSFPQGSTASFLAISFRVCLPGGVCLGGFNSCLTMMADEHVVPLPPTHGSFAPLIW